jgi:hypothetical protein
VHIPWLWTSFVVGPCVCRAGLAVRSEFGLFEQSRLAQDCAIRVRDARLIPCAAS